MKKKKQSLKKNKNRTASSSRWLYNHINDEYVHKAKKDGYRSRAAYKLLEINDKYKIIPKKGNVLDLGAAPGSWSQVAAQNINKKNIVLGIDLLEVKPFIKENNIIFIQKNFLDIDLPNTIETICKEHNQISKFSTIISDLSPNTSGNKQVDHINIVHLCEKVFETAKKFLISKGNLVCKIFDGTELIMFKKSLQKHFQSIYFFKPKSSRKTSCELYIICIKYLNEI